MEERTRLFKFFDCDLILYHRDFNNIIFLSEKKYLLKQINLTFLASNQYYPSNWLISLFNPIHNICITGLTHAVPIEHHQFIGCLSSLKYRELIEVTWEVSPTIVMQATPGCVDLCQENNPCGEGRCVNLYSSIHCDCFSVGKEGDKCQYSSKILVQLNTLQMKCQEGTINFDIFLILICYVLLICITCAFSNYTEKILMSL